MSPDTAEKCSLCTIALRHLPGKGGWRSCPAWAVLVMPRSVGRWGLTNKRGASHSWQLTPTCDSSLCICHLPLKEWFQPCPCANASLVMHNSLTSGLEIPSRTALVGFCLINAQWAVRSNKGFSVHVCVRLVCSVLSHRAQTDQHTLSLKVLVWRPSQPAKQYRTFTSQTSRNRREKVTWFGNSHPSNLPES